MDREYRRIRPARPSIEPAAEPSYGKSLTTTFLPDQGGSTKRLILQQFTTIDGLVADPDGQTDFISEYSTKHDRSFEQGAMEFMDTVDTGRRIWRSPQAQAVRRQRHRDLGQHQPGSALLNEGLIDEIQLRVVPAAIGRGRQLFEGEMELQHLDLVDAESHDAGLVLLRYRPEI